VAAHFKRILELLGEDPEREGLKETPNRVARMYTELLDGYAMDAELDVQFEETTDLVCMDPIDFKSLCEHHVLPFTGNVKIAYVPHNKVVGASKLGRLVDKYAHRLQVQERMTRQIADEFMETVQPSGLMVIAQAKHECMCNRGIKKSSVMTTSAVRGMLALNPYAKLEALQLLFSDKRDIL